MKRIELGSGLALPLEIVTQTIAIVAKRRAGKSYLAKRLAEQVFKAGVQLVIIDPKGDWWGIRSTADGKGPGLPILIIGGEHGDVPLEVGGGEVVAKLVVEERVSALLDLSDLRKHEVATFSTAFLESLYRLKAREMYRTPVLLEIDEADAIAPQKPQPNEARMLGAASDIVRRGGQRGIGCVLVTQRTSVLNKDVLTQAQILVALRTIAPQDLKAMNAWIDVHGTEEQREKLMESLPSLPIGDAWVWSPGWPTTEGIFKRIHTAPIATFDSGATPKPGERRIEPKTLAEVDLDAVRKQMADTLERAKAEDPKALRREIAELRKQLAAKTPAPKTTVAPTTKVERVKVPMPVFTKKEIAAINRWSASAEKLAEALGGVPAIRQRLDGAVADMRRVEQALGVPVPRPAPRPLPAPARVAPPPRPAKAERAHGKETNGAVKLGRCEHALLGVLAQRTGMRTTSTQLSILSGYSSNSSSFANALGALRSGGFATGGKDDIRATDEGLLVVGDYEPIPTGKDLLRYWTSKLDKAERSLLEALHREYPAALTKEELSERSGYSVTSSSFANALGKLRTLELVDRGAEIRASAAFFEGQP